MDRGTGIIPIKFVKHRIQEQAIYATKKVRYYNHKMLIKMRSSFLFYSLVSRLSYYTK